MTTETVSTSGQTTDATPVSLLERSISTSRMIRLECNYNVYKNADFTKVASGFVTSTFFRQSGGDVTRTAISQDIAEAGDTEGSMAGTQPYIELVADTGTQEVKFMAHGNSDTLNWDIRSFNIIST